jgi:hypothetical protein
VEFEINGILSDISYSNTTAPKIDNTKKYLFINCLLEDIETDNIATFRLGNSILLCELTGNKFDKGSYVTLKIPTENVKLYPTDI